uniref:Src like adaptor n=1 Tax=Salmo trutta TaxID=8032 RepID=A0A674CJK2_SALTR
MHLNLSNRNSFLSDYPSADVSETLVVLSDYPSADVSMPLFRIGERLRLLAEEGYWWRVCSVQTGYENYIPNNHVAKVYHGWLFEGVARPKAEELLRLPGNRAGSFMIRESQKGVYTLSVRHRVMVHYRIIRLPNNWYYISPGLTFQCLEDLVNHYSDCADGLCCILTTPCQTVTNGNLNLASQEPPVVMHNNFDWKDVNSPPLSRLQPPSLPPSAPLSPAFSPSLSRVQSLSLPPSVPLSPAFSPPLSRLQSPSLPPSVHLSPAF